VTRLPVRKTYKLYIGGALSPSPRTFEAEGQNVARASRKDARDAVRAARAALPAWWGMTAYNRGQILYRLAEMMEARAAELEGVCSGREEVEAAIDRVVWYAGWADKLPEVLATNPVAGPLQLHRAGRLNPRRSLQPSRARRSRLAILPALGATRW
jgi:acyl-CoA reductase-like NAD-dependent aldehyde dehydrogenase